MRKKQTTVSFSWQALKAKGSIIGLAPMDGVTDVAYRLIQKKYGQPDVVFSEFVNVEGLCHGVLKLMHHFVYDAKDLIKSKSLGNLSDQTSLSERPVIAQLYGKNPECFYQAALLVAHMGFDGVDVNMGCPAKNVTSNGAGAGLIKTPALAQEIVHQVKQAVADYRAGATLDQAPDISDEIKLATYAITLLASGYTLVELSLPPMVRELYTRLDPKLRERSIPVSIKTRTGYDKPTTHSWISTLLETQPEALSLHGRTLRQAYTGRADWDEIALAAALVRDAGVVFLGNGDVDSVETAYEKINTYGVDGVLIGRASFGNPYVFRSKDFKPDKSLFQIAVEHAYLYEESTKLMHKLFDLVSPDQPVRLIMKEKLFLPFRKHLSWYVKGVPEAKKLRAKLMQVSSASEAEAILRESRLI